MKLDNKRTTGRQIKERKTKKFKNTYRNIKENKNKR